MQNQSNDTTYSINEKPQYLCKQCGRCCSVIANTMSKDEIAHHSEDYPEESRLFSEILVEFPSIEAAKKKDAKTVENILKWYNKDHPGKTDDLTFYYCPHLDEENSCKIYETRPLTCRCAPKNAWSLFPPGCGFEGWQFRERERQKYLIRQLKEILYEISFISDENAIVTSSGMTKAQAVKTINDKISPWLKYGAGDW